MDVIGRIDELRKKHGWSAYKLAKKSGLSSSTIANIYHRHTIPSLSTIETICEAFGITLSQFFSEDTNAVPLTKDQKHFFDMWSKLTPSQKALIENIIKELYFHS